MKARYPGFPKCMAMMRDRDPQTREDGFHLLLPHVGEHVYELIEVFAEEEDHGLRCWLLELIGAARSPDAFEFLAGQLRADDHRFRFWAIRGLKNLGTKEARTLLWAGSLEETEAFRSDLDAVSNNLWS